MKILSKNRSFQIFIISLMIIFLSIMILALRPHMGVSLKTHFTKDKIKLCITGDTGMDTPIQRNVADLMKSEKCDRIIIVGDVIYPDGVSSSHDPQIKQKFDDYYLPLTQIDHKPKVALLSGNHDYSGNFKSWMNAIASRDWVFMPSRYFMEEISGFCLYYLDSTMLLRGTYLADLLPQVRWIRQERQKNATTCHTEIALTHHPYLSEGRHGNAKDMLKWIYDMLLIDQSDFMISGHSHLAKDFGKIGKTQLLVSGAGGDIEGNNDGGLLIMELDLKDHSLNYHFSK